MNPPPSPELVVRRFVAPAKRLLILLAALTCIFTFPVATDSMVSLPNAAAAPCGNPNDLICAPEGGNEGNDPGGCQGAACPDGGENNQGPNNGPGNCGGIPGACGQEGEDGPGPVVTGADVQADLDRRAFPNVVIMSAPLNKSFVQLNTSFWLKPDANGLSPYRRLDVNAAIKGQTVHAWAIPQGVVWKFGDDKTLTCDGDEMEVNGDGISACSHIYEQSSAHMADKKYTVTATLTWKVWWECVAGTCAPPGPGAHPLPDRIEADEVEFAVGEIQTQAQ